MQNIAAKKIYRILDANFNRAKEGLRVCEDVCRFVHDDAALTRQWKNVRHALTETAKAYRLVELLEARAAESDVGRPSTKTEFKRKGVNDVFFANAQRAKESLRVLEECSKVLNKACAQKFKDLRYKVYALEIKSAR